MTPVAVPTEVDVVDEDVEENGVRAEGGMGWRRSAVGDPSSESLPSASPDAMPVSVNRDGARIAQFPSW